MWAMSERQSAVAEELVARGADVNARSKTGFTALMFAAQQGDMDSARILLDAKANPNEAIPKSGATPLIIASAIGKPDVVALLLDKGANPNAVDANGFTSLHHAVRDSEYGVDPASTATAVIIVKTLLAPGATPNARPQLAKDNIAAERQAQAGNAGARSKRTSITITEIELEGATRWHLRPRSTISRPSRRWWRAGGSAHCDRAGHDAADPGVRGRHGRAKGKIA